MKGKLGYNAKSEKYHVIADNGLRLEIKKNKISKEIIDMGLDAVDKTVEKTGDKWALARKKSSNDNKQNVQKSGEKPGKNDFLNPYNFISINDYTPRYNGYSHEKFKGQSGKIQVTLNIKSPLFIGGESTEDSNNHKTIKFYRENGKYTVPATSLKGMIRNRVEILSKSCLNHNYDNDDLLNYMSYRLIPKGEASKEIRDLKKGVIKKVKNDWYFVELDSAKVLTVIDRKDKSLMVAVNGNKPEKLSTKQGARKYNQKKNNRCDTEDVRDINAANYSVDSITSNEGNYTVNPDEKNKTFAYIDLKTVDKKQTLLYGIVRQKTVRGHFKIYQVKRISDNRDELEKEIDGFIASDDQNQVEYRICQLLLKTAYDIETKTQDKVFFKFGETDILNYIEDNKGITIDNAIIKFSNMIKHRFDNFKKHSPNDYLFRIQPKEIYDGMPVYANVKGKTVDYLAYSEIPRKPYNYGIAEMVKAQKKRPCNDIKNLCPACNMFGFVDETEHDNNKKKSAFAGKVMLTKGKFATPPVSKEITLNALSTPKPTFYPFYNLKNRKVPKRLQDYNSKFQIGRKIYLYHKDENNTPTTDKKDKMNSTIEAIKPKNKINFEINFINLSNYELGLLLYAVRTEYDKKTVDFSLGMGKPYGMGHLELDSMDFHLIDRNNRYSHLLEKGFDDNNSVAEDTINSLIYAYKLVQSSRDEKKFAENLSATNNKQINDLKVDTEIVNKFFNIDYIKEFINLKLVNTGDNKVNVQYPEHKNNKGENEAFKWFAEVTEHRKTNQTLFDPKDAENGEVDKNLTLRK